MFLCKFHLTLHTLAEGSSHHPQFVCFLKQSKTKAQAMFPLFRNGVIAPLAENNVGRKGKYAFLRCKSAVFHSVFYIGVVVPAQRAGDIHHFQIFSPPKNMPCTNIHGAGHIILFMF